MARPPLPTTEFGAVEELLRRHGAQLEELCGKKNHLADCIAAVQLAVTTWRQSGSVAGELPNEGDKTLYLLGCRLLNSFDYCMTNKLTLRNVLTQVKLATTNEQQWHAESHLFVFARLHSAASGGALAGKVAIVVEAAEPSPDVALDCIGLEIGTRSPGASISGIESALSFLGGVISHAAKKVSSRWPRVIALADYSPRDAMSGNEVATVFTKERAGSVQPRIGELLREHPDVPALIHTSTLLEAVRLPDGKPATMPVFASSIELNPRAQGLPAAHRRLLEDTFWDDRRIEPMIK
jgi:hypothetical protein